MLGEDEVCIKRINTSQKTTALICESGLYKLIMRSDKPEAARFQGWVTQDVLPTIRKTGAYVMGEEKVAQGLVAEDQMALLNPI
jgi:prophage antirepressor-like protein